MRSVHSVTITSMALASPLPGGFQTSVTQFVYLQALWPLSASRDYQQAGPPADRSTARREKGLESQETSAAAQEQKHAQSWRAFAIKRLVCRESRGKLARCRQCGTERSSVGHSAFERRTLSECQVASGIAAELPQRSGPGSGASRRVR